MALPSTGAAGGGGGCGCGSGDMGGRSGADTHTGTRGLLDAAAASPRAASVCCRWLAVPPLLPSTDVVTAVAARGSITTAVTTAATNTASAALDGGAAALRMVASTVWRVGVRRHCHCCWVVVLMVPPMLLASRIQCGSWLPLPQCRRPEYPVSTGTSAIFSSNPRAVPTSRFTWRGQRRSTRPPLCCRAAMDDGAVGHLVQCHTARTPPRNRRDGNATANAHPSSRCRHRTYATTAPLPRVHSPPPMCHGFERSPGSPLIREANSIFDNSVAARVPLFASTSACEAT